MVIRLNKVYFLNYVCQSNNRCRVTSLGLLADQTGTNSGHIKNPRDSQNRGGGAYGSFATGDVVLRGLWEKQAKVKAEKDNSC